jgi:hypothetical protein
VITVAGATGCFWVELSGHFTVAEDGEPALTGVSCNPYRPKVRTKRAIGMNNCCGNDRFLITIYAINYKNLIDKPDIAWVLLLRMYRSPLRISRRSTR